MTQQCDGAPRLLVSVRNAEEALLARAGGADWIDLKEPSDGALAAVSAPVARTVATALAERCPLSAALGELRDWQQSRACELLDIAGIGVVKLGLAGCAEIVDWQQRWAAIAATAKSKGKQLVGVVYADYRLAAAPAPKEVIHVTMSAGGQYLLIDTYDKSAGTTFDHLSSGALASLLREAKQADLRTVLAGSITQPLLNLVPLDDVDMLAVRGAICRGGRTCQVELELVEDFRRRLDVRWDWRPLGEGVAS